MKTDSYKYIEACNRLRFRPEIHFVKLNSSGSIGFTIGKPEEIRSLGRAVDREGMKLSVALRNRLKTL